MKARERRHVAVFVVGTDERHARTARAADDDAARVQRAKAVEDEYERARNAVTRVTPQKVVGRMLGDDDDASTASSEVSLHEDVSSDDGDKRNPRRAGGAAQPEHGRGDAGCASAARGCDCARGVTCDKIALHFYS